MLLCSKAMALSGSAAADRCCGTGRLGSGRNAEGLRGPRGSLLSQTFSLPDLLGRAFGSGSFLSLAQPGFMVGQGRLSLRHGFQNVLMRFAMMKMQAAVSRARIMRPNLSWRRSKRLLASNHAQPCSTTQRTEPSPRAHA